MKLAIIRQRYTPFGGAERFIENALAALRQQTDLEVTVITREWNTQQQTAHRVVTCNPFHLGRVWRLWAFARAACQAVARGNYDLVQSHERLCCCDIFRAGDGVHREWLRQRDRILPGWRRALIRLSPFHRMVLVQERSMFASPSLKKVIAISCLVRDDILRHYPDTQARIEVIYNGVDLQRFHPGVKDEFRQGTRVNLGISPDASVLLFVGSGFERKGLATALRALAKLPENTHLVVVGKDRQQRWYETLARHLGIANRVHFTGPQADVRPYYGMADAFVFPSLYEPFGNVVLEALASGLPVIVSDTCGGSELVDDRRFVLDALDVESWIKAIALVLAPEQHAAMARKSREIAESLGMEVMAKKMALLYAKHNAVTASATLS